MKKVLITGANSYIGEAVETWLGQKKGAYSVDVLEMKSDTWMEHDFSVYDVVFHVAGIAHVKAEEELYYRVNRDLAIETARKAKEQGVKQFIILSSMSVYGLVSGMITKETKETPNTPYGISKYQADIEIAKMQDDKFRVCILRPPMVYGKGCKGNYCTLRKAAVKLPFFPSVKNERSMIYISNLAAFVEKMMEENHSGIYFPQNTEYVCTTDMVCAITEMHGKKMSTTPIFNWAIGLAMKCRINLILKIFGNLTYEKVDLCDNVNFENSICETEKNDEK